MSANSNRTGPSAPSTGAQSTGPGSALTGELRKQFDAAQLSEREKKDREKSWPAGHSMAPSGTKHQSGGYGSTKQSTARDMSNLEQGSAAE